MPLRPLKNDSFQSQARMGPASVRGEQPHSLPDSDYFNNINELERWAAARAEKNSHTADPNFKPGSDVEGPSGDRKFRSTSSKNSKLLVCHDFKGGYTDDPFERGYTFEFWYLVDAFIYFSHNRITIPPRAWIDAGHRHGSTVLGTVIFEWSESKPDLEECLYGGTFHAMGIPTPETEIHSSNLSFSTTYASHLITLAQARHFDGYLINIETDLNFLPPASSYPGKSQGRHEDAASLECEKGLAGLGALISSQVRQRRDNRMTENASALLSWVGWLREEGKRRVGPHWQVIWYDSVTTAGQLQWQDALSPANAPFFMNSDSILTNYTWARPPDPAPPGALRELAPPQFEHHPALVSSAGMANSLGRSASDVYIGIDVFGRNCYGGFDVGRSLEMIFRSRDLEHIGSYEVSGLEVSSLEAFTDGRRHNLGLSVGLFAPGWTWEREYEGEGERSWSEWWDDELRFWAGGSSASEVHLGSQGEVTPIGSFFGPPERTLLHNSPILPFSQSAPPNDPNQNIELRHDTQSFVHQRKVTPPPFYTNFNRGSGMSWWVRGHQVYDASSPAEDPTERRGWTDMSSCFPKPDRIWPRPVVVHFVDGDQVETSSNGHGTQRWTSVGASLIDYEAWEGGISLEVILRLQPNVGGDQAAIPPSIPTFTVLPLCTLNACHFALHQSRSNSLEMVVKPFSLPTEVKKFRELQVRPCLLWTSSKPRGGVSYRLPEPQPVQTEICELVNGWYRITTIVEPEQAIASLPPEMQATGIIAVVAVGIGWPAHFQPTAVISDLKLLVGEISFSALSQRPPASPSLGSNVAAPHPWPSSNSAIQHWDPVPLPNGVSPTSLWGNLTWEHQKPREGKKDNDGIGVRSADVISGYFNVFATLGKQRWDVAGTGNSNCVWLGTSTCASEMNSFAVAGLEPSALVSTILSDETDPPLSCSPDILTGSTELPIHSSSSQDKVTFCVQRVGANGRQFTNLGGVMYTCEVEVAREK